MKKILAFLLVACMMLALVPSGVFASGQPLSGAGTETSPYLINNLEDLKKFRDYVDTLSTDGVSQYAGKYIKLTADIDLSSIDNWNPIGTMSGDHGSFKGVFDGDGHKIKNLKVQGSENGLGFFARTAGNAEIKNLYFENATVKSVNDADSYVGIVVANSYASTKITNVHVTGTIDVSGRGYIGGISGHGYVVMDNCSVKAEGTISSTFWCAGGILGYGGEGATNIMNSSVEGTGAGLTIRSAAGGLGAIVGMAEDNDGTQPISGSNLSAKNVKIQTYVGAYGTSYAEYALGYIYGGNPTSKLTGNITFENITFDAQGNTNPKIVDIHAKVGNSYYNIDNAIAAANNGETVKLLADIKKIINPSNDGVQGIKNPDNCIIQIPAGKKLTIDLNGHTISAIGADDAKYDTIAIHNYGDLTITDTSEAKTGKISLTNTATAEVGTSQIHSTILNFGTLTINSGIIENKTAAGYTPHAVFNYAWGGNAVLTINGGTFSSTRGYAVNSDTYNDYNDVVCKTSITDGIFNKVRFINRNNLPEGDAKFVITGGEYVTAPKEDYLADGFVAVQMSDNGNYHVIPSDENVVYVTFSDAKVTLSTTIGGTLEELPTPVKPGFEFLGWFDEDGIEVTVDTLFYENAVITAQWKEIPPKMVPLFFGTTVRVYDADNGTITPNGIPMIIGGMTKTFKFIPDEGYAVADVIVNGESYGAIETLTLDGFSGYITLTAVFEVSAASDVVEP